MAKSKTSMTLKDLLITKIQSLYDIENVLIKALPKMASSATDPELKAGFEKHLGETEEHARRLERIFEILGEKTKKLQVEGIRGIVADAEWVIKNVPEGPALDAALIASAQYAEHYEMAGYGSASEWASTLGQSEVEEMLRETLDEEKNADETLTDLATSRINEEANQGENM